MNRNHYFLTRFIFGLACVMAIPARALSASPIDDLQLGVATSEQQHQLQESGSKVISGGLGEPARHLLPRGSTGWEGGSFSFTMKVDPEQQNYFTVRLWGSEISHDYLILFCEGKQVGYRHLGDIDILYAANGQPPLIGRFFYLSNPLPLALTSGKHHLHFEIRATGPIWGYGGTWEKYQKPMTEPSCGIYHVYTHTDTCFVPPAGEKQGEAPADPPVRQQPGEEVMTALKDRVSTTVTKAINAGEPLDQMQLELIAKAYHVKWTPAYQNATVVQAVIKGADAYYRDYRKDPKIAESDTHGNVYNGGWLGLGPLGHAIWLVGGAIKPTLDEKIDDGSGTMVVRRDAWSGMLQASRDWHRHNRREYTNQSMITDLYFYLDNRALEVIDPAHALPEEQIRHYLYQSVGIEPWLGSDTDNGPAKPLGDDYYELTPKALTKELGFVGYYGEVLDWATTIYEATGDPDKPDTRDEKIKAQLIKIEKARSYFRYPELDDDGNRVMRAETIVGWRDEGHYPGDITYGERPTWDASAIYCAAATLSPGAVGAFQQMTADNQFFATVARTMKSQGLRPTAGMLGVPDQYELLKAQPASSVRLPMSAGQPDFAWADETDGVLAIKRGNNIFYASLYWRARAAINFLARVHEITPQFDLISVVHEDTKFKPSGQTYTRPDWVNMGFGNGGLKYPGDLHSAEAGETLPIAKFPDGVQSLDDGSTWTNYKPGQESPFAGRGSFYQLHFGNYLIGMNCTKEKTYALNIPVEAKGSSAPDLISGQTIALTDKIDVPPQSTVILYLKN
jgi:hypothetical protein